MMSAQVPFSAPVSIFRQARHWPPQALSQQTPSAHVLLAHSWLVLQAWPWSFFMIEHESVIVSQPRLTAQSASTVQLVLHVWLPAQAKPPAHGFD
jgi:hypothetical protein